MGNFSQQPLPLPNFKKPLPNMPPMEFFRKVLPPNILLQTHPMIPQQLQPNPLIRPPQQVPPPPLRSSQSQFLPPSQPTPPPSHSRLPPPLPFQTNVTTPPPTQFPDSYPNPIQQHFPQSTQAAFPPQQNQFRFNTPPPNLNIAAAQQGNSAVNMSGPLQQLTGPTESVSHPELGSLSVQTGAVTKSMSDRAFLHIQNRARYHL